MKRRIGTTTRKIDRWVQELFTNGKVFIYERDVFGKTDWTQTAVSYQKFKNRMKLEHPEVFEKISECYGTFSGIDCVEVIFSEWQGQFDWHKFAEDCKREAQNQ